MSSPASESAHIYLASTSPRRQQLLQQIGVRFELLLPRAHEDAEALELAKPGEAPLAYVKRVTRLKLAAALQRRQALRLPVLPVLCADTTVALGTQILGKPSDAHEAARTLAALSGQTHNVLTAVAVASAAHDVRLVVSRSRVSFAQLSAAQISAYIATGEPFGKAGAYAIQGAGGVFVRRLSGSASGVIGLPLFETAALLQGCVPS